MDFFEAQRRAKQATFWLILLFAAAVLGVALFVYFGGAVLLGYAQAKQPFYYLNGFYIEPFLAVTGTVLALVAIGTVFKTVQLAQNGGRGIAEALGGRLIQNRGETPEERRLINVVEEMAIASGGAMPAVYLLEEESINAFAAGNSPEEAAIGVTRGAINTLSRDELQGVIAHEFSHIHNGDMRLNMKITGVLHGILLLSFIGRVLISSARHGRGASRSKKENGAAAVMAIGAGLWLAGSAGYFFGALIRAVIGRQREFLADAASVQYTRNPQGLAGALIKIGANADGSNLHAPDAAAYGHFYFARGALGFFESLFATHPPLDVRIRRVLPAWNGRYEPLSFAPAFQAGARPAAGENRPAAQLLQSALNQLGYATPVALLAARQALDALPASAQEALNTPQGAMALAQGLISPQAADQTLQKLDAESKTVLAALAVAPLRELSAEAYNAFRTTLETDDKNDVLSWALYHRIIDPLDIHFGKTSAAEKRLDPAAFEAALTQLISAVVRLNRDPAGNEEAHFNTVARALGQEALRYDKSPQRALSLADSALSQLRCAAPEQRAKALEAIALAMSADGVLHPEEIALFHAAAALLRLPVPLEL